MVGASVARAEGESCDAIIKGALTLPRLKSLSTNLLAHAMSIFLSAELPKEIDHGAIGLTNVFDVADDAVVRRVAGVIESAVVMPMDVSVCVKVFANDRSGKIGAAINGEAG